MPSGMAALQGLGLLPLPADVTHSNLRCWSFWLEGMPLFSRDEPEADAEACVLVDPDSLLSWLAAELERQPSATLRLGSGVSALLEEGGRIRGVRLDSGARVPADLVVACDGRGSRLRRWGGLEAGSLERPIDVLWFELEAPASDALKAVLAGRFHTLLGDSGSMALHASPSGSVQLAWPLQAGQRQPRTAQEWRDLWCRLAPPQLAEALLAVPPEAIRGPQRLAVQVGLARRWWRPGLLLLGDAAHPMSPVRAQGTAMGLRDALAAAPLLHQALAAPAGSARQAALDAALEQLERQRRPEITLIQRLQQREWQRGQRLMQAPLLRRLLAALAPGLGPLLAGLWWQSQGDLRQGLDSALPSDRDLTAMMGPASASP